MPKRNTTVLCHASTLICITSPIRHNHCHDKTPHHPTLPALDDTPQDPRQHITWLNITLLHQDNTTPNNTLPKHCFTTHGIQRITLPFPYNALPRLSITQLYPAFPIHSRRHHTLPPLYRTAPNHYFTRNQRLTASSLIHYNNILFYFINNRKKNNGGACLHCN